MKTLANMAAEGLEDTIIEMTKNGATMKALVDSLSYKDTPLLLTALDAIENILYIGQCGSCDTYLEDFLDFGGIEALEQISNHPCVPLAEKVTALIEKYVCDPNSVANEEHDKADGSTENANK